MIIGCTGNYRKDHFFKILDKIQNFFIDKKIKVFVSSDFVKDQNMSNQFDYSLLEFDNLIEQSDIIFAIGGDGTILSTIRRMHSIAKPVLGVHIGGLGFLSECNENNLTNSMRSIINNNYSISKRMLLKVSLDDLSNQKTIWALNDIVISCGGTSRMIRVKVKVSDNYLNTFDGDGIILSTPTGSTAYSLSAGGPIISPSLDSISVIPVCSHSLSARPIVVRPEEEIELSITESSNDVLLSVDGQININLGCSSKVYVSKANHYANIIDLPDSNYYSTLRKKMGWSGNIR